MFWIWTPLSTYTLQLISVLFLLSDISCWLHVFSSFLLTLNKLPNIKKQPNINQTIPRHDYLAPVSLLSFNIRLLWLEIKEPLASTFPSTCFLASLFLLIVLTYLGYFMLKNTIFLFITLHVPLFCVSYLENSKLHIWPWRSWRSSSKVTFLG